MALYHQHDYRRAQSARHMKNSASPGRILYALFGLFCAAKLLGFGIEPQNESKASEHQISQSTFWSASSNAQAFDASGPTSSGLEPLSSAGVVAPSQELRFVEQAHGRCHAATVLRTRPGGGEQISDLVLGTPVAIGGTVRVPSGLRILEVYWVRIELASGVLYGFASADSIQVDRGNPLDIKMRGLDEMAFLNPAPSTEYSGGEEFSSGNESEQLQMESRNIESGWNAGPAPEAGAADRAPLSIASFGLGLLSPRRSLAAEASAPKAGAAEGESPIEWLPPTLRRWLPLIESAGKQHGVDPSLIAIIALVESGGDPSAKSPSGALGLMQVMPLTGQDIADRRGIRGFRTEQLLDPATNIDFGTWYIAQQLQAFGQPNDADWQASVELAAAAYNGGPTTVMRYLDNSGGLPNETQRYRQWVGGMWAERNASSSPTFQAWLGAGGHYLIRSAMAWAGEG